jgi:hypothetical protein
MGGENMLPKILTRLENATYLKELLLNIEESIFAAPFWLIQLSDTFM